EILDRVVAPRLRAPRDADTNFVEVGVEQISAVSRRVSPAADEGASECRRRVAIRVVLPGDVLGDEAERVAVLADTLRRALAVRGVTKGVRARQVIGELLGCAGQTLVCSQRAALVLRAKTVRQRRD